MRKTSQHGAHSGVPGKKPLDSHLLSGSKGTVDDVRVASGFPIWNLVDAWIAAAYDDQAILRDYHLDPAEWDAAKRYYLNHKPIIDARIITNTQPDADDDIPPLRSVAEYFTWLTSHASRGPKDSVASEAHD